MCKIFICIILMSQQFSPKYKRLRKSAKGVCLLGGRLHPGVEGLHLSAKFFKKIHQDLSQSDRQQVHQVHNSGSRPIYCYWLPSDFFIDNRNYVRIVDLILESRNKSVAQEFFQEKVQFRGKFDLFTKDLCGLMSSFR